ncbi:MAG: NADH:ubiquinone reductase (Na(+)-transporting) subunit A, partial [Paludibacteraceae bacterium]|nr:NADH:ubiquinone reductase (Na(+)-transporting) subunit A [Paludibacteraceae bacterium]
ANKGKLDFTKTVAFAGPVAAQAAYYKITLGVPVGAVSDANVSKGVKARIIAGNVLSGEKTASDEFLSPFVSLISVIPEGDETHEMLGWIMPRLSKYSVSGSFLSGLVPWLRKHTTFNFDTRILGGERHMIMSGEYDKVFPMDIYPEFLLKAIIAGDIDKMEALGIYEVVPEDFAAAEFVCSSKMELQKIVREGLDAMRKEMC